MLEFNNIGISALAACVPGKIIDNCRYDLDLWPESEVCKIVEKTGVRYRRFAGEGVCASDLCVAAAEKLFADNNLDRSTIDLLVFVSQTPDYRMPATSKIIQSRLGLPSTALAFDITLGCSGFVEALSVVCSMLASGNFCRALLLDGETRSKVYNRKDRQTAFLFGDAGSAALVERDGRFGKSFFSVHSDGSKADMIMIPGGGYRNMSSSETIAEKTVDSYGNVRSSENGYMKGADVFSFVLENVPADIRGVLDAAGESIESIDYFLLHQANSFINGHLESKLGLPSRKTPHTIEEFGNTSSVSIPLTMVSRMGDAIEGRKTVLLSAFGVGMSWASAVLPLVDCKLSELQELCG